MPALVAAGAIQVGRLLMVPHCKNNKTRV